MRKKTLSIVLDAFIVLLVITIIFLIVMIVRRGEPAAVEQEVAMEVPPVVSDRVTEEEATPTEAAPEEEEVPEEPVIVVVNTDTVNIRSGAGTSFDVLGVASKGDEYKLIETMESGWSKIEYRGSEGYIFNEYIDQKE
ncbi:MAG: SH3 domain-containing protein [Lachnospiraceae bacterium]|nr:SH3 domain-containing protein [Lachnospiraceae bacterium]